jgi:hypothetical protein
MIEGVVNARHEAIVRLTVRVPSGAELDVDGRPNRTTNASKLRRKSLGKILCQVPISRSDRITEKPLRPSCENGKVGYTIGNIGRLCAQMPQCRVYVTVSSCSIPYHRCEKSQVYLLVFFESHNSFIELSFGNRHAPKQCQIVPNSAIFVEAYA